MQHDVTSKLYAHHVLLFGSEKQAEAVSESDCVCGTIREFGQVGVLGEDLFARRAVEVSYDAIRQGARSSVQLTTYLIATVATLAYVSGTAGDGNARAGRSGLVQSDEANHDSSC